MTIRNQLLFLSIALTAASACGGDTPDLGPKAMDPSSVGDPGGATTPPPADAPPDMMAGQPGDTPPAGDATDDAGLPTPTPLYVSCQNTDQAFVRNAIFGVLGRRPHSQAEVNVLLDLIKQIEDEDGTTPADRINAAGMELTHSRQVVLDALFRMPEYRSYWSDLYRDLIRVQRVDEQLNLDCFESYGADNPIAAAKLVRDRAATQSANTAEAAGFTMRDVIEGSVALDDISPIYTANLFAMLSLTYAGANATPEALELTRRADFGAWFDEVYLHRDVVCLGCHNSEFSVTETDDPATNRHYPIPFTLEKTLFGASTGPAVFGGFEGGDREHAPLRYLKFVNDCSPKGISQADATAKKYVWEPCASPSELIYSCFNSTKICESEYKSRQARPWGWAAACGLYAPPEHVLSDVAGVEAKFGNITGLRTSPWDLAASLRAGFEKLRSEGLKANDDGSVDDPDKAFAYLVAMNIAEKAWIQIVGTPLTIPNRFPRNAASRDQLKYLTDTLVSSGFSNQALLSAIFASPYLNVAQPSAGCGSAYDLPNIFDPWVIAEEDPTRRPNSPADGVVSMTARTASNALYSALDWTPIGSPSFPDYATEGLKKTDPQALIVMDERQFQEEVGFYLKNSQPGFRGFDFQARLGWEDRFGTCTKLEGTDAPDYIDKLALAANTPDRGTVRDLVSALKDRLLGRASIGEADERPALELLLGASLDADANSLVDPAASLRRVCGVMVSSPQFLLLGMTPEDANAVPRLTPVSASYEVMCGKLSAALPSEYAVTCNPDGSPLLLNGVALSSR